MEHIVKAQMDFSLKKQREPTLILEFFIKSLRKYTFYCLGDYISDCWTMNWQTYNFVLTVLFSFICYLIHIFQHRADLKEMILTISLIMYPVIGFQRCHIVIFNQNYVIKVLKEIFGYTKIWENSDIGYPILLWYLQFLRRLGVFSAGFLIIFVFVLEMSPIIWYELTGKFTVVYELYLPFIGYQSHPGFELHWIFQAWCLVFAIGGLGCLTFYILLIFIFLCIRIDIITARLCRLSEIIVLNKQTDLTSLLKDIYEDHQSMIEFLDELEDLLSYQQLSDHFIMGLQMCVTLVICMKHFWIPGYYIILSDTFMLFSLDLLGTIIEVKLEKLSAEAYNVPWYLMSITNQKSYNFFMAHTQNCARLTLWGRVPLNLDTFVRLCKGIYSYMMVLREVQI